MANQSALQYCLTFMHRFKQRRQSQPSRATASSGTVRVRRLVQEHLDSPNRWSWTRLRYWTWTLSQCGGRRTGNCHSPHPGTWRSLPAPLPAHAASGFQRRGVRFPQQHNFLVLAMFGSKERGSSCPWRELLGPFPLHSLAVRSPCCCCRWCCLCR